MKHCLSVMACLTMPAAVHGGELVDGVYRAMADKPMMEVPAIREASGLAVSRHDPEFLWVINDSGADAGIHLIKSDGASRGMVTLKNARNVDWEDLASFTMNGKSFLLVADTGDNEAKRDICTLYILREPAIPATGETLKATVSAAWSIRFRYEGGPRDCESVAVDAVAKKILLLSKRTDPPELHELPLLPTKENGTLVTRKIGTSRVAAPIDSMIPFRNQPTAMDISADGSLAAVLTYYGVFVFPKKPGEEWSEAMARKPVTFDPHGLAQAESIAVSEDNNTIFVISEGRKSPIVRYRKSARPPQERQPTNPTPPS
jgi:hypothetical protein